MDGPLLGFTLVSLGFSAGITRDRWLKKEMACPEAFSLRSMAFPMPSFLYLLSAEQHSPVKGDDDFFLITKKIVQQLSKVAYCPPVFSFQFPPDSLSHFLPGRLIFL